MVTWEGDPSMGPAGCVREGIISTAAAAQGWSLPRCVPLSVLWRTGAVQSLTLSHGSRRRLSECQSRSCTRTRTRTRFGIYLIRPSTGRNGANSRDNQVSMVKNTVRVKDCRYSRRCTNQNLYVNYRPVRKSSRSG